MLNKVISPHLGHHLTYFISNINLKHCYVRIVNVFRLKILYLFIFKIYD